MGIVVQRSLKPIKRNTRRVMSKGGEIDRWNSSTTYTVAKKIGLLVKWTDTVLCRAPSLFSVLATLIFSL